MTVGKTKGLTQKQKKAIELLTSGEAYTLKEVAEQVRVNPKTLWDWRNEPQFAEFQEELNRVNNERWAAAVDAARQAAIRLCKEGNQKMVQFVLQNEGYNPTHKVEADLHTDINITIEE